MFSKTRSAVANFIKREEGLTATEYAAIVGLVLVVCIGAVVLLGQGSSGTMQNVADTGIPTSSQ